MIKFLKNKTFKKRGESLLEVLVAVVILGVFLSSILSMVNNAMATNQNIRMRVMALNLAREGIEGVRNIRDTNWLKYSGNMRDKWNEGIVDGSNSTEYGLQFVDNKFSLNTTSTQLYLDSEGFFTHIAPTASNNHTQTPFSRIISTEPLDTVCPNNLCPQKIKVTSTVQWTEDGREQEVVLEAHLYDYFKRDNYDD